MFRLLSRQAVKAVPRPGRRLSSGTTVDPQAYFTRKHQQEAKERGEFIDIHDIGGIDPADFDVLISDVDDNKLRGEVAEIVGIPYHTEATMEDANKVVEIGDCYIYGWKIRTIFPAVVARGDRAHWGFFVVDSGSPLTYLSASTSDLFNVKEALGATRVKIAGYDHLIYRSPVNSHFTEINLLGMDFCKLNHTSQWNYFGEARAKLFFGRDWKVNK